VAGGPGRSRLRSPWWLVAALTALAGGVELWGAWRDLPFPDVDEHFFVHPAIHIAATGDLDPHWFGHPGSTVIYPLALLFHAWDALAHHGPLLWAGPELAARFRHDPGEYYLIGRLWTIAVAMAVVPVLFALGRRVFNTRTALAACALWVCVPIVVQYARIVRTDTEAVLFGTLALLTVVTAHDRPTRRTCVLAGVAIGLAISSRYFMVALVPILVVAVLTSPLPASRIAALRRSVLATTAAVATFLVTTPYFLLDQHAVADSLRREDGRSPGRDGLSWLGNVRWYLGRVLPHTLSWPVTLLVVAGVVLALTRWNEHALLLLGFAAAFVAAVSASPIHWERWLIPVLPTFVLLAASALDAAVVRATRGSMTPAVLRPALVAGLVVAVALASVGRVVALDRLAATPSTRVLARRWMEHHLVPGSRVGVELKTAPLHASGFRVTRRYSLGRRPLGHYEQDGFRYLVTNGRTSHVLVHDPATYPNESRFYRSLVDSACRVHEFRPSARRTGPVIAVWELVRKGAGACHRAVDALRGSAAPARAR
jgi:hypothetical protein